MVHAYEPHPVFPSGAEQERYMTMTQNEPVKSVLYADKSTINPDNSSLETVSLFSALFCQLLPEFKSNHICIGR